MRLRLIVHRHGLPPAHILWNTDGLRPNHHASGTNSTVAQLLEQVNEVIPLEAEEWGLEDYVVEVGGFECVHFSILKHVLKDEDEVTIRPLQHTDRRFLRVSGRHQISADGKHLIDGVAFGRPFLRHTDRPPIRIPSIKRPRLVYDDVDDLNTPNQLILRETGAGDLELDADEDEFNGIEEQDVPQEGNGANDYAIPGSARDQDGRRRSSRLLQPRKTRRRGLGIHVGESPPTEPEDLGIKHSRNRQNRFASGSPSRRSSRSSTKSLRVDREELETPATVVAPRDSEDEDDDDFDPDDTVSDISEGNKENIQPLSEDSDEISSETSSASTSTILTSSTSSSATGSGSSISSVSSSNSPSSISESEHEPGEIREYTPVEATTSLIKGLNSSANSRKAKASMRQSVPPGLGLRKTKKRNERRKKYKSLHSAKLASQSFPCSKIPPEKDIPSMLERNDEEATALAQRKETLLQALTTPDASDSPANQMEAQHRTPIRDYIVGPDIDPEVTMTFMEDDAKSRGSKEREEGFTQSSQPRDDQVPASVVLVQGQTPVQSPRSFELVPSTQGLISGSRSKLDLASTRRLLFRSLGLRTPRNKAEEDHLRSQVKESFKDTPQSCQENMVVPTQQHVDDLDDSWEERIELQAVECCDEGVKLSKPPFPFVQRWDPQQQGSWNGGYEKSWNKGKRRKRNNKQYYQTHDGVYEDYGEEVEDPEWTSTNAADLVLPDYESLTKEGRSVSKDTQAAVDQQILEDTQRQSPISEPGDGTDLPELPPNLSDNAVLSVALARPGALIAFKQMEMSERTNWCPIISPYRTAEIVSVLDDGTLDIRLAARDVVCRSKRYDQDTGERLYAKFEMPQSDDEQEDERNFQFSLQDMIEPKIVQSPEALESGSASQSALNASFKHTAPETNIKDEEFKKNPIQELAGVHDVLKRQSTDNADPEDQVAFLPNEGQKLVEMSESVRREYSLLMKDAGFRSDIAAEVNGEIGNPEVSRRGLSPGKGVVFPEPSLPYNVERGSSSPSQVQIKADTDSSSKHVASSESAPVGLDGLFEESTNGRENIIHGNCANGNKGQELREAEQGKNGYSVNVKGEPPCQTSGEIPYLKGLALDVETNSYHSNGTCNENAVHISPDLTGDRKERHATLSERKGLSDLSNHGKVFHRTAEFRAFSQPNLSSRKILPDLDDLDGDVGQTVATFSVLDSESDSLPSLNLKKRVAATSPDYNAPRSSPRLFERNDSRNGSPLAFEESGEVDLPKIKIPASQAEVSLEAMKPQVIDLTISSDAIDPDGSDREHHKKKPKIPPAGSGWVQKMGVSERSIKSENTRARKLRRTRSNV